MVSGYSFLTREPTLCFFFASSQGKNVGLIISVFFFSGFLTKGKTLCFLCKFSRQECWSKIWNSGFLRRKGPTLLAVVCQVLWSQTTTTTNCSKKTDRFISPPICMNDWKVNTIIDCLVRVLTIRLHWKTLLRRRGAATNYAYGCRVAHTTLRTDGVRAGLEEHGTPDDLSGLWNGRCFADRGIFFHDHQTTSVIYPLKKIRHVWKLWSPLLIVSSQYGEERTGSNPDDPQRPLASSPALFWRQRTAPRPQP